MSPLVLMLILVSLATFVAGQLLLKRAMDSTVRRGFRQRTFAFFILTGTGAMAVSYFLNLGLLQQLDLSFPSPSPLPKPSMSWSRSAVGLSWAN